ncbi:MAG: MFS transporter [Treponema sp.]|jgi:fucose permease|nr:MFS transporter [Treponema sp.]
MATLFLILIYLSFIGLGLPDSLLGAAWPVMRLDFSAPVDAAGLVFVIISGGTILSSLLAGWALRRFGTGRVTALSVVLTAGGLLGSSLGHSFWHLMLMAVPLGLGAGSVDSALNNYVALHYKAQHMSWLHCFWGVGAFTGPLIIGAFLRDEGNWRGAYRSLGLIQGAIAAILLLSLPLWRARGGEAGAAKTPAVQQRGVLSIPGVPEALITFALYCSCEYTVGLWGASFLTELRGFSKAAAASAVALYYGGITIGRFFAGFLSMRFPGEKLIRGGLCVILCGAAVLLLPLPGYFALGGLLLVGLGCSPVFPAMLQLTPKRFGAENSPQIIGLQMASAYTGITLIPPLVGVLSANTSMLAAPIMIAIYAAVMLFTSEQINRKCTRSMQHEG